MTLDLPRNYPNLAPHNYRVTSPEEIAYNCVAWALSVTDAVWWPDSWDLYYWPPQLPRQESVETFLAVFGRFGYTQCDEPIQEEGFEKVAVYLDERGRPSHVARQLSTGRWTSKLGGAEDIEHDDLGSLEGPHLGSAVVFLRRSAVDSMSGER